MQIGMQGTCEDQEIGWYQTIQWESDCANYYLFTWLRLNEDTRYYLKRWIFLCWIIKKSPNQFCSQQVIVTVHRNLRVFSYLDYCLLILCRNMHPSCSWLWRSSLTLTLTLHWLSLLVPLHIYLPTKKEVHANAHSRLNHISVRVNSLERLVKNALRK